MAKKKKGGKAGHFVPEEYRAEYDKIKKQFMESEFDEAQLIRDFEAGKTVPMQQVIEEFEAIVRSKSKKRKRA